ncbi:hypothetical protein JCM1393_07520 [Clostridium carnis]
MSYILNGKCVKKPYEVRAVEKICVTGILLDEDNRPIAEGVVIAFVREDNAMVPVACSSTDRCGKYKLNISYKIFREKNIVILHFKDKRLRRCDCNVSKINCNIKIKDVEDIIIYGRVLNCNGSPVQCAIVTAFYEVDGESKAICHSFTGSRGEYMLNIPYRLYRGKKITVKSVKTNLTTVCKC